MVVFVGLIILSIAVALLLIWFIVTRVVSRLHAVILLFAALIIVSGICITVGYFGLRVRINDHYEINLVALRFFVLPPIAAGALAALLSTAMFSALKRRERALNI